MEEEYKGKIIVDENSVIKVKRNGVNIRISLDFVKSVVEAFKGKKNYEIVDMLQGMSQKELHELFAGGVVMNAEELEEKEAGKEEKPEEEKDDAVGVVPPVVKDDKEKQEEQEKEEEKEEDKAEEEEEKEEEEQEEEQEDLEEKFGEEIENPENEEENRPSKLRKWLLTAGIIGGLTLAVLGFKGCEDARAAAESEMYRKERDKRIEQTVDMDGEEQLAPETIKDENGKIKTINVRIKEDNFSESEVPGKIIYETKDFILYIPYDSTQIESAITNFGNQEHESNVRRDYIEGSNGELEWNHELEAIENFDENKEAMEKLNESMAVLLDESATDEEKLAALNEMLPHAETLRDNYNQEKAQSMFNYAKEQSELAPDEITEKEIEVAERALAEYATQEECQTENTIVLSYIKYLQENGCEIKDIKVDSNARGDLFLSIDVGGEAISYDEFKEQYKAEFNRDEIATLAEKEVKENADKYKTLSEEAKENPEENINLDEGKEL